MKKATWMAAGLLTVVASVAVSVWAAPAKSPRDRMRVDVRRVVKKYVYQSTIQRERLITTFPDLIVDDVRIEPGTPKATVVVTIRNQGTAVAHGFYTDMRISRGSEAMVQWAVLTPINAGATRELTYDDLVELPGRTTLSLTVDPPTDDRPFGCQLEGIARADLAVVEIPGEGNNTATATYSGDPTNP